MIDNEEMTKKYFQIIPVSGEGIRLSFQCPGCGMAHTIDDGWKVIWRLGKPSVYPSILDTWRSTKDGSRQVCHIFIRDGQLVFLSDSTNELAGKTVDMIIIE